MQNEASSLASALVHFLWQGAALGLLAWALMRVSRPSAATRYAIGVVTLGAMLAAPVATFVMLVNQAPPAAVASVVAPDSSFVSLNDKLSIERAAVAKITRRDSAVEPVSPSRLPVGVVLGAWLGGVAVLSLRLAGGWVVARRLTARAVRPVAADVQAIAQRVAGRLALDRVIRVLESSAVAVPMMVGWLKPVVLLPTAALAGLSPSQLEALIAHELAHVRRHDYLINLLQSVVETVLFYHPAVWWVSRQVRTDREHCCDDMAVTVCDRLTYVSALSSLASIMSPQVALAASGGSLFNRVRRLVGPRPERARSGSGWLAAIPVLVLLASIMPAAFEDQQTVRPPAMPAATMPKVIEPTPAIAAPLVTVPPRVALPAPPAAPARMTPRPLSSVPTLGGTLHAIELPTGPTGRLSDPPAAAPIVQERPPATPQVVAPKPYRVGPGDTLQFVIVGAAPDDTKQMNRALAVQPNGTIDLPSLGAVNVQGMTPVEIQEKVGHEFVTREFYLRGTLEITVLVVQFRSQEFIVQGAVASPGTKRLKSNEMRLSRAIAEAGNFTRTAGTEIEIRRKDENGKLVVIRVTRAQLDAGDDPELLPDDWVEVKQGKTFFVNGEVISPGQKRWEPGMTVARAIQLSGGVTPRASAYARSFIKRSILDAKNNVVEYREIARLQDVTPILPDDELVLRSEDGLRQVAAVLMFSVGGEVNAGGARAWEKGMTVGKAVELGGGATANASLYAGSYILRPLMTSDGTIVEHRRITNLNADTLILAGDQLVIRPK